jgi:ubiquinone/menaquinone biosynthesis C-methylase UbiE
MHRLQPPEHQAGVAAYYDRLAPVYGEGEFFRARRSAVLAAIAAELDGARAVLDLGCGNGAFAAEFVCRAPLARVVGADLSPEMLHAARQRLGLSLPIVRADATALPFAAGSFDLVFMSHVLLLVRDLEHCVGEVSSCLRPGGWLAATVGSRPWRELVGRFLGAEDLEELEAVFGSTRLRAPSDDEARVARACVDAGLQATWRRAPFSVTWPAVEEWVRIRWMTIVDDDTRARAERWLMRVRERAAELTLPLAERLLIARKLPTPEN